VSSKNVLHGPCNAEYFQCGGGQDALWLRNVVRVTSGKASKLCSCLFDAARREQTQHARMLYMLPTTAQYQCVGRSWRHLGSTPGRTSASGAAAPDDCCSELPSQSLALANLFVRSSSYGQLIPDLLRLVLPHVVCHSLGDVGNTCYSGLSYSDLSTDTGFCTCSDE
jgi:hypothetical protein